MADAVPTPAVASAAPPVENPAGANMIRLLQVAEETPHERLMRKHLPAWVVSGACNVIFLVIAIVAGSLGGKPEVAASEEIITAAAPEEAKEEEKKDLTNPDDGLDSNLKAAVEVDRVEDVNIDTKVIAEEPVGVTGAENLTPTDTPLLAGIGPNVNDQGVMGDEGNVLKGAGGMSGLSIGKAYAGRSGATKEKNLKAGGGNEASERAVARALIWLSKQQKAGGNWVYEGDGAPEVAAATGMAILPFLAAGQTHKPFAGNKYQKNVENGINFLLKSQLPNRTFSGIAASHHMYSHAIATIAL
ncbi:MAG: hypothetical protein ACRCZF_13125, partial [Gemmataceae bacterium]